MFDFYNKALFFLQMFYRSHLILHFPIDLLKILYHFAK